MSKLKPNDPCRCGSGKKTKKCCGVISQPRSIASATETRQLQGTFGLMGIPLLVNITPFNSNERDRPDPAGSAGKYTASFLLGKPNQPPLEENHLTFEFDASQGNSHLFVGDPNELHMTITSNLPEGNYEFTGYANNEGYLSKIEIREFDALNMHDAMDKAFNALYPVLSRISVLNNMPVFVYRWAVKELSTHNHMSSIVLPFINMHAPVFENVPKNANFEKFSSLYREGLNSNSPNYQFLCFYKIIEGLRKNREERVRKENDEALRMGNKPFRPREVLPSNSGEQQAWLNALYGRQRWSELAINQVFGNGAAGRKINDLIAPSRELDTVRNKIAHTVLRDETKDPLTIDNGSHIREVDAWLPLCKSLALYLLMKEYPVSFTRN